MRGVVFILSFAALCGSAQASSLVVLGETPSPAPSIVTLGQPEPAATIQPADRRTASTQDAGASGTPSIVALGEPAISDDKVAAIPATSGSRFSPMVIRAGIVGGGSAEGPAASGRPASGMAGAQPETTGGGSDNGTATAGDASPTSDTTPQKAPL
jgi:hypothetical protein